MRCHLLLVLLVATLPAFAQSSQPQPAAPEQYSATAFITSGAAQGKSVGLNIFINSYTTDDEVKNYLQILKTQGQDGLEKAFDKTKERGRIAIGWLVVEDFVMILTLVLLPPVAETVRGGGDAGFGTLALQVLITLGKVAAFVADAAEAWRAAETNAARMPLVELRRNVLGHEDHGYRTADLLVVVRPRTRRDERQHGAAVRR